MRIRNLLICIFSFGLLMSFAGCDKKNTPPGEEAAQQREKQFKTFYTTTMADMKNIGQAIESYMVDKGEAPQVESFADLNSLLSPDHIRVLPLKDSWGNNYIYRTDAATRDSYWIASPGADGTFDGFEQRGNYLYADINSQDIIFSNGAFQYCPR